MRLNEADLKRVRRRIGLLWPRVIGLGSVCVFVLAVTIAIWVPGKDKQGRPLQPHVYIILVLNGLGVLGWSGYYLPKATKQYIGLLRDLREQSKETILAAVKDKREVMWNMKTRSFYFLVFDFGRVEVGKTLYEKARRGHLLTLVLSTHGRELLSVSEVEMKTVSD
jgi:hypothetical protein